MNRLSQLARLVILAVYLAVLFLACRLVLGTWIAPFTSRGVWFYSALSAVLLGSLLVSPFFTKPADAVANAVAALITLMPANYLGTTLSTVGDQALWTAAMAYVSLVLVVGVLAIATKNASGTYTRRVHRTLFLLAEQIGAPRVIFSVVFLFAIVVFHRASAQEVLVIGLAWAVFVGLTPLEALAGLFMRCVEEWRSWVSGSRLGVVVGHESPGLVLIREDGSTRGRLGDVLLARTEYGEAAVAVGLDHVGFSEGRWLRAFFPRQDVHKLECPEAQREAVVAGEVFVHRDTQPGAPLAPVAEDVKNRFLGVVAPDTRTGGLEVELVRSDLELTQGRLLEVNVGGKEVLYQLLEGVTREEVVQQKNTRGYVRAQARKVGAWNAKTHSFDSVAWLPAPNDPVWLAKEQASAAEASAVGHIPRTPFPVTLDMHTLVTHNTAILGILGVGKTFLALELVERMLGAGIKVLCLDLTDQYASELASFRAPAEESAFIADLQQAGATGKDFQTKNPDEGGSLPGFRRKVREVFAKFLDPNSPTSLMVLNPAELDVWKQDGKMFSNQAPMARLTPTEVTRVFTEAALEVLQKQGVSTVARCCIVYEEAHSLIPEWNAVASDGDRAATNGTAKAILQGRKFGLGCLVVTQRTANVTKTILNQCNTILGLRVYDATGVEFLKNYFGDQYAGVLSSIEERHAVVFGRASSCRDPVVVRLNDRADFVRVFRARP